MSRLTPQIYGALRNHKLVSRGVARCMEGKLKSAFLPLEKWSCFVTSAPRQLDDTDHFYIGCPVHDIGDPLFATPLTAEIRQALQLGLLESEDAQFSQNCYSHPYLPGLFQGVRWEDLVCDSCGDLEAGCECCSGCHQSRDRCECCPYCSEPPGDCNCDHCPRCHEVHEDGYDNCDCDRCPDCGNLTDQPSRGRRYPWCDEVICPECDKHESNCTCDRCAKCNDLVDECTCEPDQE